jgi:hypothetical protein
MDKRGCGSVRRCDFYEASTEHVTLDMRRTITKGDLYERFRSSAVEMTLTELLQRLWPVATDADRKLMNQWTKLYDASSFLSAGSFQGTHHELKQIFDLLDLDGSRTLSMSELVRARILTKFEAHKLMQNMQKLISTDESGSDSGSASGKQMKLSLGFSDFCLLTQKHLTEKYVHKEDGSLPKDSWDIHCRTAFQASAKKVTLKGAATSVKTVVGLKAFANSHRNALHQAGTAMAC